MKAFLAAGAVLASVTIGAHAQVAPAAGTPAAQAISLTELVRIMVDTCPLQTGVDLLKYQQQKLSAQEFVQGINACPSASLVKVARKKAETFDPIKDQLASECRAAVVEVYTSVVVHWENYASSPTEPIGAWERRVNKEAAEIKSKASRARVQCSM